MIEDEEHTRQEVERLISREFEKLKVQDITTEIYKTAEEFGKNFKGRTKRYLPGIPDIVRRICSGQLCPRGISVYFEKRYEGTFAGSITENLSGKAKREPEFLMDRRCDGPEKIIS